MTRQTPNTDDDSSMGEHGALRAHLMKSYRPPILVKGPILQLVTASDSSASGVPSDA